MKFFKYLFVIFLLCLAPMLAEGDKKTTAPSIEIKIEKVEELKTFLNDYEKKLRNEFQQDFNEARAEGGIYNPWTLDVDGRLTYRGKFLCMMMRGYDYRGGAHGVPYMDALYFDGQSHERLEQSALLMNGAYEKLAKMCRSGLIEQGFDADDDWMLRGTEPTPENYALIVASQEKVEVIFNSYQVAPYAAGVPSVTLSWSQFAPLLKAQYRP